MYAIEAGLASIRHGLDCKAQGPAPSKMLESLRLCCNWIYGLGWATKKFQMISSVVNPVAVVNFEL